MSGTAKESALPSSGVLVVDKPSGPTSHDVVAVARRLLGTRAVGHAGTLDPMASGVLLLLVGEGTKLSHWLTADSKRYRAEVSFGRATDTLDSLGATLEERPLEADWFDAGRLRAALEDERQRTLQVPPAYSAIKVGGRRAHRLSRGGERPELLARSVRVHEAEITAMAPARIEVELTVSKGYYVRAFARDLGERLGVPAHLSGLRRLASGVFTLEEASAWPPADEPHLISVSDAARRAFPTVRLTLAGVGRARQGRRLLADDFAEDPAPVHALALARGSVVGWLDPSAALVALGERRGEAYHVVRGFGAR